MPTSSLEANVDWAGPINLPSLTERLFEEKLGGAHLKELLEERDRELVDALCGPRYHPTNHRFRRAGTRRRILCTRFGRIQVRATRVKDQWTGRSGTPLWDDVRVRRGVYQMDVIQIAVDGVQRMTYRNTLEELGKTVNQVMSPMTLHRCVRTAGTRLNNVVRARPVEADAVLVDGTFIPAGRKKHHPLNLTLATRESGGGSVACLTTGEGWTPHRIAIDRTTFRDRTGNESPPKIATDLDPNLPESLTPEAAFWSPCHIHILRHASILLWKDGVKQGPEKKRILARVNGLVRHLRNSLNTHLPKGERKAVQSRIQATKDDLRGLAFDLWHRGRTNTAWFLNRVARIVTLFASLAFTGQ